MTFLAIIGVFFGIALFFLVLIAIGAQGGPWFPIVAVSSAMVIMKITSVITKNNSRAKQYDPPTLPNYFLAGPHLLSVWPGGYMATCTYCGGNFASPEIAMSQRCITQPEDIKPPLSSLD